MTRSPILCYTKHNRSYWHIQSKRCILHKYKGNCTLSLRNSYDSVEQCNTLPNHEIQRTLHPTSIQNDHRIFNLHNFQSHIQDMVLRKSLIPQLYSMTVLYIESTPHSSYKKACKPTGKLSTHECSMYKISGWRQCTPKKHHRREIENPESP